MKKPYKDRKYIDDSITLYLGDCLEVMKIIPDKSINMILCDLPYGTTKCKWDVIIPFEPLWEQYNRIIKDERCIALFGNEPFSSYLRLSNIDGYKYDWVWDKISPVGHLVAKKRPMQETENISVFNINGNKYYYPIFIDTYNNKVNTIVKRKEYMKSELIYGRKGKGKDSYTNYTIYNGKYPRNIIKVINNNHTNKFHPTQKPIELMMYLIKTYTKEGELVLDNCMGSESTGVACKLLNRKFIGIEKDKRYFDIAYQRIENPSYKISKDNNHGELFNEDSE